MADLAQAAAMTLEEFLAWEEAQPIRHERYMGVVRAMTGGTIDHNVITLNAYRALHSRLRGTGCRAFANDVRVVSPNDGPMYPDVLVVCEALSGKDRQTTAPAVVIEVLSASTEAVDQGRKRWAYQAIPSLRHYVLVDQNRPVAEVASRDDDGSWRSVFVQRLGAELRLDALGLAIPLREVFDDVTFLADTATEHRN